MELTHPVQGNITISLLLPEGAQRHKDGLLWTSRDGSFNFHLQVVAEPEVKDQGRRIDIYDRALKSSSDDFTVTTSKGVHRVGTTKVPCLSWERIPKKADERFQPNLGLMVAGPRSSFTLTCLANSQASFAKHRKSLKRVAESLNIVRKAR
ncbi:MAG: hypothetical protein KC910_30545 [Candidatus Eremiobacteraeota bacterium]|nr:hypothetical protein [Candidatus Eremiobacteraeota bacterium]